MKLSCPCGSKRFRRQAKAIMACEDIVDEAEDVVSAVFEDFSHYVEDATVFHCEDCGNMVDPNVQAAAPTPVPVTDLPPCTCDVWSVNGGCTCGVFQAEQKLKETNHAQP